MPLRLAAVVHSDLMSSKTEETDHLDKIQSSAINITVLNPMMCLFPFLPSPAYYLGTPV